MENIHVASRELCPGDRAGQALARMWNERCPDIPARSCDEFRSATGIAKWVVDLAASGRSRVTLDHSGARKRPHRTLIDEAATRR
jgi:hypothetical protein